MIPLPEKLESSLPSAADLMGVIAAGDVFHFNGHTFSRDLDGWWLTNPYGIDCAFFTTESQFQRLLDAIAKGADIGPVP